MVSYNKLWKKLIDLKLNNSELKEATVIGSTPITKLTNDELVSMEVMMKICLYLECDIGDIMTFTFNKETK